MVCANNVCVDVGGGDDCNDPIVIMSLPYMNENDTSGFTHKHDGCLAGNPIAGIPNPDVVYMYTTTSQFQLVVEIKGADGANAQKSTLLSWDKNCPMLGTSCASTDFYTEPTAASPAPVKFCTSTNTTYYFIVDSTSFTDIGAYQLHVYKGSGNCSGAGN